MSLFSVRRSSLLLFAIISACASRPPATEATVATAEPTAQSAPNETPAATATAETASASENQNASVASSGSPALSAPQTPQPLSVQLLPAGETSAKQEKKAPVTTTNSAPTPPPTANGAKASTSKDQGVDPKQSLHWLQNGNTRFVKHRLRGDGQSKKDVTRLAGGQHPHAVVIACSDSRVPPEIVFDQKLGEIFVVRTAGEVLDLGAVASVEYAVAHLGTRLILVMGHTSCGAIYAAAHAVPGDNVGSPALGFMVADVQPRIKTALSQYASEADLAHASYANAQGVAADLTKRSEIVREAVEKGEVIIQSALYHLDSGEVKFE